MTWIRVDSQIGRNPKIWAAAEALRASRGRSRDSHTAVLIGHLVMFWAGLAEAGRNGQVDDVTDALIESWAGWVGEPGKFAAVVRAHFVTDGYVNDWDEYQGRLEQQRAQDRERQRRHRLSTGQRSDSPRDIRVTSPGRPYATVRNDTELLTTTPLSAPENAPTVASKEASNEGKATPTNPKKHTWLSPYSDSWKAQYGGELSAGPAVKALAPLHKQHGEPETLRRWRIYLGSTAGQFASPARFAQTWGTWDVAQSNGARSPPHGKPPPVRDAVTQKYSDAMKASTLEE